MCCEKNERLDRNLTYPISPMMNVINQLANEMKLDLKDFLRCPKCTWISGHQ